jgi:5-methyltetrahydropteroyltriglutamate--homocysteine methyltransferase
VKSELLEVADFTPRASLELESPACVGPISFAGRDALDTDIANLRDALAGRGEAFMNAASPGVIRDYLSNRHYASDEEYLYAIADAMRHEYETIASAGITLQVDCPDLGMGRHIQHADLSLPEWRKKAELHVEALNHALANIPPERLRMHLCWGNYEGPHHCDVALADVIDIVFKARPSAIALEAANPRHAHEWKLFETVKLPEGKVLVPGVIESKSNFVEHPELVADRVRRFVDIVGPERVIAGTDCGFGTSVGPRVVPPSIAWKKLESLVEGAALGSAAYQRVA